MLSTPMPCSPNHAGKREGGERAGEAAEILKTSIASIAQWPLRCDVAVGRVATSIMDASICNARMGSRGASGERETGRP